MSRFWYATFDGTGRKYYVRAIDQNQVISGALTAAAVSRFQQLFLCPSPVFTESIAFHKAQQPVVVSWGHGGTPTLTTGLGEFRIAGEVFGFFVLLTGIDRSEDIVSVRAVRTMISKLSQDAGYEMRFDLADIPERPQAATFVVRGADPVTESAIGLTIMSAAAAYFGGFEELADSNGSGATGPAR